MEILNLIENSLHQWRKADIRMKSEVLHQLRNLRNLHLLLAHSSHDAISIEKYLRRIDVMDNVHFVVEKNTYWIVIIVMLGKKLKFKTKSKKKDKLLSALIIVLGKYLVLICKESNVYMTFSWTLLTLSISGSYILNLPYLFKNNYNITVSFL